MPHFCQDEMLAIAALVPFASTALILAKSWVTRVVTVVTEFI